MNLGIQDPLAQPAPSVWTPPGITQEAEATFSLTPASRSICSPHLVGLLLLL